MNHSRRISVTGLGYVGLPVAVAFGRKGRVVGFDVNTDRIQALKAGRDWTSEVSPDELRAADIHFTSDPAELAAADFHIVAVPTPIDADRQPDLAAIRAASSMIGASLKKDDIVVFESTVYPGATEEDCRPILERCSGLKAGIDFGLGYSPERINPGDPTHRFETIRKVVSAGDEATLDIVAQVYGSVVSTGVYRAPSIKVAEAAKVIENTQRDINIALINELSIIFNRLDIDTADVLAAAGTKWNFLPFRPGLVGGHCIGVDPYYLTHKAERVGYHPQVVLAGRATNDNMGRFIARETIRLLMRSRIAEQPRVTVLGLTFKENVPDIRNSRVVDIVDELEAHGIDVATCDPIADADFVKAEMGFRPHDIEGLRPAHAVVLAVAHQEFVRKGWKLIEGLLSDSGKVVIDVKGVLDRASKPEKVTLWRL
jgi:UDP-N-acetyl-D-glucosamine/UDP-N-acetyl-D-galactosamine dehydrogenase